MSLLQRLSQILIIIPIIMLLFDLVKGWFIDAELNIRTLEEWGRSTSPELLAFTREFLMQVTTAGNVGKIMQMPGALVMFIPPAVLYILYRLIFLIRGGKGAGAMYKSRH